MIFVTHNLGIVARMCDKVAVMYAGPHRGARARRRSSRRPPTPTRARCFSPFRASGRGPIASWRSMASRPTSRTLSGGGARSPRAARERWIGAAPTRAETALGAEPCGRAAGFTGRRMPPRRGTGMDDDALAALWRSLASFQALLVVRRGALGWSTALVRAVDSISFTLAAGRTLGVVGESGCGKTTTSKLILGLERPTAGAIRFEGQDIVALDRAGRGRLAALGAGRLPGPVRVARPAHAGGRHRGRAARHQHPITTSPRGAGAWPELLDLVGLPSARPTLYPHEFSGGQRQRVAIARALALSPKLVVLDEPVSALDVSIRAQLLNLLTDLQKRLDVSYLFIAHDLAAVAHMSHAIAVMYLGKIVEWGDADTVALAPQHPYTRALFASRPAHRPRRTAGGGRALGRGAEPHRSAHRMPFPSALPLRHASLCHRGTAAQGGRGTARRLPPLLTPRQPGYPSWISGGTSGFIKDAPPSA